MTRLPRSLARQVIRRAASSPISSKGVRRSPCLVARARGELVGSSFVIVSCSLDSMCLSFSLVYIRGNRGSPAECVPGTAAAATLVVCCAPQTSSCWVKVTDCLAALAWLGFVPRILLLPPWHDDEDDERVICRHAGLSPSLPRKNALM